MKPHIKPSFDNRCCVVVVNGYANDIHYSPRQLPAIWTGLVKRLAMKAEREKKQFG